MSLPIHPSTNRSSCAARVAARLWLVLAVWLVGVFGGVAPLQASAATAPSHCMVASIGVAAQSAHAMPESPTPAPSQSRADAPIEVSHEDRIESIEDDGRAALDAGEPGQRRRLAVASPGPEPGTPELGPDRPPPRG
jgi:hypothetical protein